jgi:serine protease AprX
MNIIPYFREICTSCFLILFLLTGSISLHGQPDEFQYFYRVYFRDKGDIIPGNFIPSDLLSERAISRREKAGIPVPDIKDIPLSPDYLEQIKSMGLTLHCTSKWMNTALFKSRQPFNEAEILSLPFVNEVKTVKKPAGKGNLINKFSIIAGQTGISAYDLPITMINGDPVQASGFDGRGILIAVLDAGFINANKI